MNVSHNPIPSGRLLSKIPAGADSVYVRVDENKLYWVKGDETGAVDLGDDDVPLAGFDPAIINGDRDGDIHIPWLVALLILLLGYAGYFLRYQTRIFELRREIAAVEQTLRKERWK